VAEYKNALVSPVPEPTAIEPGRLNPLRKQANPESGLFSKVLPGKNALGWAAMTIAAFHLAYAGPRFNWLIVLYLFGLAQIARVRSGRMAFYLGLGVGFGIAAPQLLCFWTIFKAPALVLWLIIAFWTALFVFLANAAMNAFGAVKGGLLMPVLWTGLEYFRSELYYLKFSWLNVGYALADSPALPIDHWVGMYGAGFLGMAVVVWISMLAFRRAALLTLRLGLVVVLALFFHAYLFLGQPEATSGKSLRVAGVQLEFPAAFEAVNALDRVLKAEPKTDILVLSEYTFDGPYQNRSGNGVGRMAVI